MKIIKYNGVYDVYNSGRLIASFQYVQDAEYFVQMRTDNPQNYDVGETVGYECDIKGQIGKFKVTTVKITDSGKVLYKLEGKPVLVTDLYMRKISQL